MIYNPADKQEGSTSYLRNSIFSVGALSGLSIEGTVKKGKPAFVNANKIICVIRFFIVWSAFRTCVDLIRFPLSVATGEGALCSNESRRQRMLQPVPIIIQFVDILIQSKVNY